MNSEFQQYREKLIEKANALGLKIRGLDEETPPHDEADVAQGNVIKEMAAVFASARTVLSRLIGLAIQRIDDGDYNICLSCGEVISPKRLEAAPWSPFCVGCQEDLDQGLLQDFRYLANRQVPKIRRFYAGK